MDDSYPSLATSHLLGSVPVVVDEEKRTTSYEVESHNLQIFPPNNGVGGGWGYHTLESPSEGVEQQPTNNWKGVFSISSYTQYFNVDTDFVLNRLMSSLYPINGGFFSKIDR
ncbi:uncharacterized protein LOC130793349 [Actinidia eriantha]|uniref:uncharacterized protein LOC130793349 n=1 Tax=Actinidia eriantha TaxID=165200 RepID=UPI00258B9CE5|nr:uncharacterized protein LOC130793349 [Actinidia eriantha]